MINEATTELIEELISKINRTFNVENVIDNGDGTFTLEINCSSLWLRPCKAVELNGFKYRIIDFVSNKWIKVEPIKHNNQPLPGEHLAPKPVYFYGTVRMVNGQLNAIGNSIDFTPMIYFVETYTENYDRDPETVINYETDISLLFMDDSNYEDWGKAEEHYTGAINPMRNLVNEFIKVVESSGKVGELDSFSIINHSNFGVFQNNQGHVRRLLEADLSGCELRLVLPVCVDLKCENQCK